jgi:diguanylate cyclase (GGDEF)-like protein
MYKFSVKTPRWVAMLCALVGAWLAAWELHAVVAPHLGANGVFDKRVHLLVLLIASGLTLWRAVSRRGERLAWALIGAGVLAWTGGEIYYTLVLWDLPSIPIPSAADGGYLAFPVLAFAGICVLARARVHGASRTLWADGLVAALAVGAASAAVVLEAVVVHTSGHPLEVITNLAYPVTDLVLLAVCVGVVALRGWRLDRTWALLGAGVIVFWIADSLYLVQTAAGTYTPGGVFDVGWWLGLSLVGTAAWQPAPVQEAAGTAERAWMIVLPVGFAALAAAVLGYGCLRSRPLNPVAVALALAALAAVVGRLVITFRAFLALLDRVQVEAVTDALTGLANRRALIAALDARAGRADPVMLAVYDLDGFKAYNDTFGHQAGDALLTRRGAELEASVPAGGRAYRMGGDEFCVLVPGAADDAATVLERCARALSEHGEGFSVTCSWGAVAMPSEAMTTSAALQVADERMYAHKRTVRARGHRDRQAQLHALPSHPHQDGPAPHLAPVVSTPSALR